MAKDNNQMSTERKSANYSPSCWNHDFVQSLKSDFTRESKYGIRAEKLKEEIRCLLNDHQKVSNGSLSSSSSLLQLISNIQRLGFSYHFDNEIKDAMEAMFKDNDIIWDEVDLFTRAVRFRLLRQHGFDVPQEVFKSFVEETRSSMELMMKACMDNTEFVQGILSAFESSFYAVEGEKVLEELREVTSGLLNQYASVSKEQQEEETNNKTMIMKRLVSHALGIPLHWVMQRLEARWYIDTYEMMEDRMEPLLLEFAKLDFNMIQADFQEDLKHISRWWQEMDYLGILKFSRDRWVECFFWSVGCNFEPKFRIYGRHLTKISCVLTTTDDMYDIYSSPDEIKMFTEAVERWDINTVDDLPYHMKICFMALFNALNDIAYDVLKKHGFHAISYLKTSLADFCKSYLEEEKWHNHTPTLEEYINIAWISVSGSILPAVGFFVLTKEPTKEALDSIMNYNSSEVRRGAYTIMRLTNDLATSSDELERGDTPTSIQCYMHQTGVSESATREHIKHIISETWMKMNNDKFSRSVFSELFIDSMLNVARASQCIYQFGDGFGVAAEPLTKRNAMSLFVEPIPVACDEDSA
ncbi:hypothetical protein MKW98_029453 [Papaver atlanticum]|uniref:Uncharacterized protein n=1 Tax=Papaver atlanticum TaxID=357466 RepID=A0AAD4SJ80_9MAGN|nr:hypothetical protein MKW98_029453 [Papaver atlanticum]